MNDQLHFYRNDETGDWRWRVVADNHRVVLAATEGYRNRADAEANARRFLVLAKSTRDDVFLVVPASRLNHDRCAQREKHASRLRVAARRVFRVLEDTVCIDPGCAKCEALRDLRSALWEVPAAPADGATS